jgi:RsiW-degrading membrane proteinase PrsW (M82 family)
VVLFTITGLLGANSLWERGSGEAIGFAAAMASFPLLLIGLLVAVARHGVPEPRRTLLWAAGWGAFVATTLSGNINMLVAKAYNNQEFTLRVVVLAPLAEELAKFMPLLLLHRWGRIRTPLQGALYAIVIGAGFAAVENIWYFRDAIMSETLRGADGAVWRTFMARAIASPFAHPVFTMAAGILLGVRRGRVAAILGLPLAAAVHGAWNMMAINGVVDNYPHLALPVVFLPVAIAFAGVLIRERRVRSGLLALTEEERDMVSRRVHIAKSKRGRTRYDFEVMVADCLERAASVRDVGHSEERNAPGGGRSVDHERSANWSAGLPWYEPNVHLYQTPLPDSIVGRRTLP